VYIHTTVDVFRKVQVAVRIDEREELRLLERRKAKSLVNGVIVTNLQKETIERFDKKRV